MMRSLILVFVALTLSGCATPSYVEPLARFAQAAEQSEQALTTLNDDLADDYREEIRAAILERRELRPSAKEGECELGSSRCRLDAKAQNPLL